MWVHLENVRILIETFIHGLDPLWKTKMMKNKIEKKIHVWKLNSIVALNGPKPAYISTFDGYFSRDYSRVYLSAVLIKWKLNSKKSLELYGTGCELGAAQNNTSKWNIFL